jgi:uncharacterized coiled-coil protein SlyX
MSQQKLAYQKRYSDYLDYDRPPKTVTEGLQKRNKIEEQLEDYVEVTPEDLDNLKLKTHIKYIGYDINKKKELFRLGGILRKIYPEYIVLQGKFRFSVQRYSYDSSGKIIHKTRFFKPIDKDEILQSELDMTIKIANDTIGKQNAVIKKQQKELEELKKKIGMSVI